jgi:hypothetical protein
VRRIVTAVAVVAILAGLLAVVVVRRGTSGSGTTQNIRAKVGGTVDAGDGIRVEFPPDALDRDTRVRVQRVDAVVPNALVLTPAVDVNIGEAQLIKAATLALPLTSPVPPQVARRQGLSLFSRNAATGVWTAQEASVDAGGRTLLARVGHFSIKRGGIANLKGLGEHLAKTAKALAELRDERRWTSDAKCVPEGSLYKVTTPGANRVKACTIAFDVENPARLKVANNRTFPQFLQLGPLARVGHKLRVSRESPDDPISGFFTWLGDAVPDQTFLASKGEVVIGLPPDLAAVQFAVTPSVQALTAEIVVNTLATIPLFRVKGGLALTKETAETFRRIKDVMDCGFGLLGDDEVLDHPTDFVGALGSCLGGADLGPGSPRLDELVDIGDVISQAAEDLTTLVRATKVVFEASKEFPFGATRQQVRAERIPLFPGRARNETSPLPAAVTATLIKLADAAAGYAEHHNDSREALGRLEPATGLMYANAADPDQQPSLRLGEDPDPIAGPRAADALVALTIQPPLLTGCGPIGRLAYVFSGLGSQKVSDYVGQLQDVGYPEEQARLIGAAAAAAGSYTLCLDRDGSWRAFVRGDAKIFAMRDLQALPDAVADADSDCSPQLAPRRINPFVPAQATCLHAMTARLDRDPQPDRVLVYQLGDKLVARTVLSATGRRVDDLVVPSEDFRLYPRALIKAGDVDGRPGEEILIRNIVGANTDHWVILTATDASRPALVRTGQPAEPLDVATGGGASASSDFGCVRSGSTRLLALVGASTFSFDGQWSVAVELYAWNGSDVRLVAERGFTGNSRLRSLSSLLPGYGGNQCKATTLPDVGPLQPIATTPEAAARGLLAAAAKNDRLAAATYIYGLATTDVWGTVAPTVRSGSVYRTARPDCTPSQTASGPLSTRDRVCYLLNSRSEVLPLGVTVSRNLTNTGWAVEDATIYGD